MGGGIILHFCKNKLSFLYRSHWWPVASRKSLLGIWEIPGDAQDYIKNPKIGYW